jgi:repressor LexA
MRQPLTDRQREIYAWVRRHFEECHHMPSVREIGEAFGIMSPNGVMAQINALVQKGWIERHGKVKARALKLAGVRVVLEEVV